MSKLEEQKQLLTWRDYMGMLVRGFDRQQNMTKQRAWSDEDVEKYMCLSEAYEAMDADITDIDAEVTYLTELENNVDAREKN